jgi:hypothetical protein
MGLRVRLAPFTRTGVHLVDLAMRSLHEAMESIIDHVRREVILRDVEIPNGGGVTVPHGLGYAYSHVSVSPVRGASSTGRIAEDRTVDAKKFVRLTATGFGAAVTVDLRVT